MKVNRFLGFVSVLLLAAFVAACSNQAATNEPSSPVEAAPTDAPAIGAPVAAVTEAPAPAPTAAPQATTAPAAPTASGGSTLQTIKDRGELICGSNDQVPGFGSVDASGQTVGFDIDFCRALAAAIFGDPNKVTFRPLTAQERFTAVQSGEVDVLIRNTTNTLTRETVNGMDFAPTNFFDGQGIMVRKSDNLNTISDLDGATICVQSGTTTELNLADAFRAVGASFTPAVFEDANGTFSAYDAGQCDAVTTDKSGLASRRLSLSSPEDHVIMDVTLSKEPLAPAVLQGDAQWRDIVTWVIYGLFNAEEYGVTQANVQEQLSSDDPNIRRLLGVEGELGAGLGLDNDFMVKVISAVGNYGEIYDRHLGPNTPINIPRGPNAQYTDGGLIYGMPFR